MSKIQEFKFSTDLLRALLWEYNDAENLQGILERKNAWYVLNHEQFWSDWYRDVFNLDTANSFGLSVWAIILDLPLVVTSDDPHPDKPTFGFAATHKNFNNGNFQPHAGDQITLTTEQKRMVLKLRYFYLVSRGTIPEMNRILNYVFGAEGGGYVIDGYDMNYVYVVFDFSPSESIRFILDKYNIWPRPAGVGVKYITPMKPITSYTVAPSTANEHTFSYPDDILTTAFEGAKIKINIGSLNNVTFECTTPASAEVSSDGLITVSGPGAININILSAGIKVGDFTLNPTRFFYYNNEKVLVTDAYVWAENAGGKLPEASDYYQLYEPGASSADWGYMLYPFRRAIGSLCSEWGDMSVYGWANVWQGGDGRTPSAYLSGSSYVEDTLRGCGIASIYYFDISNANTNTFNITCEK